MSQFPAQPTAPIMHGLSTDETTTWVNAHNWAYSAIVASLKRVEDGTTPDNMSSMYADWFENVWLWTSRSEWDRRRKIVLSNLTKMAQRMSSSDPVVYEKSSDATNCQIGAAGGARMAFTDVRNKKIGLCPNAFDVHWIRFTFWDSEEWARAFILVHEMYHLALDATAADVATSDSYYNWTIVKSLHNFNPELAVKNAQNYAYFAMGIGWTRPNEAPNLPADYGIWNFQTPGADWGSATGGLSAAKATDTANLVMFAYREPEEQGARLWSRIIMMDGDRPILKEARPFNALSNTPEGANCVSLTAPSLASDGLTFYCAYIDKASQKVVAVEADLRDPTNNGVRSDYRWEDIGMTPDPSGGPPFVMPGSMPGPSPAFAVYRTGKGKISFGLYCLYLTSSAELKCMAKLDELMSRWHIVPFDRTRFSVAVTPSLIVFNGQLRCGYLESEGHFRLLNYIPAEKAGNFHDAAAGTWKEDSHPPLAINTYAVALGQVNTAAGPRMVAIGNTPGKDSNLSYALYDEAKGWTPVTRLATVASTHGPALANIGSGLHLFYRNPNGTIESRFTK